MYRYLRTLALGALTLFPLAAAGCVGGATDAVPDRAVQGFELSVLPETELDGGSGDFTVTTAQQNGETVAVISVANARGLKALYFDLAYDPGSLHPTGAAATGVIADTARLATLSVLDQPGVVSFGQVALHPDHLPGFSGSGELARVRFATGAAPGRRASAAPTGEASRGTVSWDPATGTMSWSYYNQGDYDQNGEVNVADLTPLARFFRLSGPFDPGSAQSVVDGDSNGEINLADITPIGLNLRNQAEAFRIYRSTDQGDIPAMGGEPSGIEPFDEVTLADAIGNRVTERLRFEYALPAAGAGEYVWVRPVDGDGGEGMSYSYAFAGEDDTESLTIELVSPALSGDGSVGDPYVVDPLVDYEFRMVHSVIGDVSMAPESTYGVSLDAGTLTNADALLYIDDAFDGSFTVTGFYGEAIAEPQLVYLRAADEVIENTPPQASLSGDPLEGVAPLWVGFDASGSTDADGQVVQYEWDYDGDGTYDENTGSIATGTAFYDVAGAYSATVRVTDDGSLTSTASVLVTVGDGGTGGDNEPPVSVIQVDRSFGEPDLTVNFDGSWSYDLDGDIVNFEWDFDGDGTFDTVGVDQAFTAHTFTELGDFEVALRVTDDFGDRDTNYRRIHVGITNWNVQTISSSGFYGGWPNMVEVEGQPAIAYFYEEDNGFDFIYEVRYRRATDSAAGVWTAPVVASGGHLAGALTDMELVDGNPAIVYHAFDDVDPGLYYGRASDALGSSWGGGTRLGNGAYNGYGELKIVNGNPAVAFLNDDEELMTHLAYRRAGDGAGSNWDAPVEFLEELDALSAVPALGVIDGMPAIACFDSYGPTMLLLRGADAAGSSFTSAAFSFGENDGGYLGHLLAGDHLPQIVYNDSEGRLRYMRASDMGATGFEPAMVLDDLVESYADDYAPRLAYVDAGALSVPAVAYFSEPATVMYIQALDENGSAWGEPEPVYQGEFGVNQIEMVVIDGRPRLAWSDMNAYSVMYAEPK